MLFAAGVLITVTLMHAFRKKKQKKTETTPLL